jgi:O-methyltransferase
MTDAAVPSEIDASADLHSQAQGRLAAELYLALLKDVLLRINPPERYKEFPRSRLRRNALASFTYPKLQSFLRRYNLALCSTRFDRNQRKSGSDWPSEADTMIGVARLNNLHDCVRTVLEEGIPGDFIETGVWRGGSCIFMRAALKAYGDPARKVWVADSFEGLPRPEKDSPADIASEADFYKYNDVLGVSLDQVKNNFERYGLLDAQVEFLKGWFNDTLPSAPIGQLAILRLDGDMYSSTIVALESLFPKVSVGGFIIVDDYVAIAECRQAVTDYRAKHNIKDPIVEIDSDGAFWRKSRGVS